ncbi:type IV toxin-antitoxin system AbiEi family antitoxin domain-containing protein [Microbacterium sp. NPDC090007]|uniref:type IV toxin-antitoxin system AbiEi family antitoxin domain-containing protein n=1 Tax=Microbacterium sp. NPDC090007 TaxID=3364204 RepID=UPI0038138656
MAFEDAVPLISRQQLEALGWHSRRVRHAVDAGDLQVLRRGVYVRSADLARSTTEEKIVVRARALASVSRRAPLFCGLTAAALLGLPVLRDDGALHIVSDDPRSSSGPGVVRHRGAKDDAVVIETSGVRCTSLARTVVDVARSASHDAAVCVADAALRQTAFSPPGTYDAEVAAVFRDEVRRIAAMTTRGRVRVERVIGMADGRAQLPGESISRLRLLDLGFATPSLQVPVPGPRGGTYWVDFGLDDVGAWGEFDGRVKYRELATAARQNASDIVEREKQREDWIRGTTQRRLARWGWRDVRDARTLGQRLRAFGIEPPRRQP